MTREELIRDAKEARELGDSDLELAILEKIDTLPDDSVTADNTNPVMNVIRGFYGRGNQAMGALNPWADKEKLAMEKEWMRQHPESSIGSIAADIAMSLPMAAIPGANAISGSALYSGLQNFLTTPGDYSERSKAGAAGMAGGAIGQTITKALPSALQIANRLVAPFGGETSKKKVIARLVKNQLGDSAEIVARRLDDAKELVPGSMPTAAEAAENSGGLSAIQRWAAQATPEPYQFRQTQNANARGEALAKIAGTDTDKLLAKNMRGSLSKPFYEAAKAEMVPIDESLIALLKRPSMSKALDAAERISAEKGVPISQEMKQLILTGENPGSISGEALHHLKIGLDALRKDPKNPLAGEELAALKGTIAEFEKWRETNIPVYAFAQKVYKGLSKPVNRMAIGQELYNKAKPALTDYGVLQRETPQAFARALRDSDVVAKKATGFPGATLENTMSRKQLQTFENVAKDLSRKASADEAGRGIGSNTFQNFAMKDAGMVAGMPGKLASMLVNKTPVIGGVLNAGVNAAESGAERNMQMMLADILLDPKKTAELIRMANNPGALEVFLENIKNQSAPGLVSGALSGNLVRQ